MKNLLSFLLVSMYVCLPIFAAQHNKVDLFSQLPNKVRKQIVLPLIADVFAQQKEELAYTLYDVKNILMSCALVSKKSYEQTNCIFFTRDAVEFISKKAGVPKGTVALSVRTKGMRNYYDLSYQIHMTLLENKLPQEEKSIIRALLEQGADVNFQTAAFGTTPLMKATELVRPYSIELLMQHGANVNAKNDKGYVREYSIVCKESLLNYLYDLANIMQTSESRCAFYKSPVATYIRTAFNIDSYLAEMGGKTRINPYTHIILPNITQCPGVNTVLDFILHPCCNDCVFGK